MIVGIAKIKSPLFYMGNKYELIEKLHMYFPKKELYNECKPKNIIKDLHLLNISYEDKAKFGHFL